jgi:uncharacterized protein YndB with AHSA1/START domain
VGHDDVLRSATFRLLTSAPPEVVWGCLLCPTRTPRYLHGLAVTACWEAGQQVALTAGGCALTGEVLHVRPLERLSLTVEDASGSCTYLTWTLRRHESGGTVVRLQVEECDSASTSEDDLEDAWLPVLDRLGTLLREETPAG